MLAQNGQLTESPSSPHPALKGDRDFIPAKGRASESSIDLRTINGTIPSMADITFVLKVVFYRSEAGNEPVREWLKELPRADKQQIGEDIKTAQLGWPLGMPLIRKIEKDLWEVRTRLTNGIARVFFTVDGDYMILLHGFTKKSQKTPQNDLKTAITRLGNFTRG
jgi:phage-related protein